MLNIERLIDKAARDLGLDRLEIRRKNFIRPDQFPYRTGVNVEYDSGDYEKSLAEALRLSDYDQMMQYRDAARARGELVGVGISTFVEPSGGVGFESATVRVERTGEITVLTGASSHGQDMRPSLRRWWPTSWASPWSTWRFDTATRWRSSRASAPSPAAARSWAAGPGAGNAARHRQSQADRRASPRSGRRYVPADGGFAVAGVPDNRHYLAPDCRLRPPVPGSEPGLQETVFFDPGAKPGALARTWRWCALIAKRKTHTRKARAGR